MSISRMHVVSIFSTSASAQDNALRSPLLQQDNALKERRKEGLGTLLVLLLLEGGGGGVSGEKG